jgi:hypothetical protein
VAVDALKGRLPTLGNIKRFLLRRFKPLLSQVVLDARQTVGDRVEREQHEAHAEAGPSTE